MAARDGGTGVSQNLPADARRAVQDVAAELGLDSPEVMPLPGGHANCVLRLRDARHDLVLRIAGARAGVLGARRASEAAMQALAAGAGLAPGIVLARPGEGLLVVRYAAGRMLAREDLHDLALLPRIGAWIARLHALPPPPGLPFVDFGARAAGYLATIQARAPAERVSELARRLEARRSVLAPARAASCHHDLHHRNFIDGGGRLMVVDWEYAGPGDPAADLAACIGYHELAPAAVDALLAGYGTDNAPLRARLATLGWIFDCLWHGWNAVAALDGMTPDPALQARLEARLLA